MGPDFRVISKSTVEDLPSRLRQAGFDVTVQQKNLSAGSVEVRAECRRGDDVQIVEWGLYSDTFLRRYNREPNADWDESKECDVLIWNAWSWWPSTFRRRRRLQKDVTAVIEQAGGYWPFPKDHSSGDD